MDSLGYKNQKLMLWGFGLVIFTYRYPVLDKLNNSPRSCDRSMPPCPYWCNTTNNHIPAGRMALYMVNLLYLLHL